MTQTLEQPQTQLATRHYEPKAPVGDANGLKALLIASKKSIAEILPKHITPERLIKTLLVAANRTPKLFECTQMSVLETINRAAELGLDLSGTLGEAYPVPFGNVCQLIIGYRGLEKLAWQSGEIASIDAEVVYEKDDFKFKKGTEVVVDWSPYLKGDRGAVVGAYACVTMKSGGKLARFLPVSEIEKVRKVSRSGQSGPWTQWWDEMARKTALRRVLKDAPLSTEKFAAAMDHDAEDGQFADVVEANTSPRGTAALVDKLRGRRAADRGPDGEPITIPPGPESQEEAEAIIASRSPSASPQPAAQDSDEAQAGGGEEADAQQPHPQEESHTVQGWRDAIFAAMRARGIKTVQAAGMFGMAVVSLGKKNKENEISEDEWATMLKQAEDGIGAFAPKK